MPDYEVLEVVLFQAIPRRDVKPLAKNLLAHFGGLHALVQANANDLLAIEGMTEGVVVALKAIETVATRMAKQQAMALPVLNSWERLLAYCHTSLAEQRAEQFRVLFLNKKNHLLADELKMPGTVDQVSVYPREILKKALELGATALVLVHNHPSGDPTPSAADIELTQAVRAAVKPVGIVLHDHVIIAKTGHLSFKTMGLL